MRVEKLINGALDARNDHITLYLLGPNRPCFFGKKKLGALLSVVLDLHWADGGPYLDPLLHKNSDLAVENSIELSNLDKF